MVKKYIFWSWKCAPIIYYIYLFMCDFHFKASAWRLCRPNDCRTVTCVGPKGTRWFIFEDSALVPFIPRVYDACYIGRLFSRLLWGLGLNRGTCSSCLHTLYLRLSDVPYLNKCTCVVHLQCLKSWMEEMEESKTLNPWQKLLFTGSRHLWLLVISREAWTRYRSGDGGADSWERKHLIHVVVLVYLL